jgi:glycosyltransferase involved in cell wall biosynthesis
MRKLKVSIIIPTHNRPYLLGRLLESILEQTFRNYEVIVVNDASRNESGYSQVIKKFKKKIKHLHYFRNFYNRGAPYCRNFGILHSKHSLIALVDDDDEWVPSNLAEQVSIFEKKQDAVDLVYSDCIVKNERGKVLERLKPRFAGNSLGDFLRDIQGALPNPSATLIKKKSLMQAGLFDESLTGGQDWDMWIRLLKIGCYCEPVGKYLTIRYTQKMSFTGSWRRFMGHLRLIRKHFALILWKNPFFILTVLDHFIASNLGMGLGLKVKIKKMIGSHRNRL